MEVQELLLQMQQEQRVGHTALVNKVDEGFAKLVDGASQHELEDTVRFANIDKRMDVLETTRRTFRWLTATAIAAVLAGAVDFFINHAPKIVH